MREGQRLPPELRNWDLGSHPFVGGPGDVYCRRCGAAKGAVIHG